MKNKNEFPDEILGFNIELEAGDLLMKPLEHLRINLLKEVMEYFAFEFGDTKNEINYEINAKEEDFKDFNIENNIGILGSSFGEISDYKGEFDGKIGSSVYKQGKGKVLEPNNMYDLFHTFGYGANRSQKYTGVKCCEIIIRRLMDYIDGGCSTLQNMFMMYHLGMRGTWEEAKQEMIRRGGLRDQGTGRFISAAEWIKMQESYQIQGSNYMHMPLSTKPTKTKAFLFPLVTFISRQEQGVNSEVAADLAFKAMNMA